LAGTYQLRHTTDRPREATRQDRSLCRRSSLLLTLLGALLVALALRVAHLQGLRSDELSEVARKQQKRLIHLPARPGNIFARTRGGHVLLAGSRQVPCIYADPLLLGEEKFIPAVGKLSGILGIPAEEAEAVR